jgi:type I restriction enzyme S subunit
MHTVNLPEICEFISGGTPSRTIPKYFQGTIPWITSSDLTSVIVTKAREYITQEAVDNSATKVVPKENILLVTRTGVGKVAITGVDICISQDFTGLLIDKTKINVWYLYYFLFFMQDYFTNHQRGATIQGISREVLEKLKVPLPPIQTQYKVAALLQKADRVRRLRRYARELSDGYLQSVFLEMFGRLFDSQSTTKFSDVLTMPLMNGVFDYNENYGAGTSVIWVDNLYYETPIKISGLRRTRLSDQQVSKFEVKENDLLFTRSSLVKDGIGQINLVPPLKETTTFECHIIRARVDEKIVNPVYLLGLYRSSFGKKEIQKRSKTSTMTTIGQDDLSDLPCPIPPIEQQSNFEVLFKKQESLTRIVNESSRQAEQLFQSLLRQAFEG